MKKYIALFAWWFVIFAPRAIPKIGPFDTKEQCEEIKKETYDTYKRIVGFSKCWEYKRKVEAEKGEK